MESQMDSIMANAADRTQHTFVQHGGSNNRQYNASQMVFNQPARPETPPSPCSTVPFSRDPDFVPRPDLINEIDAKADVPGARVAIVDLGGTGKTQLAIEYARQVCQRRPDTWVLWVHAATAARFKQSVQSIAVRAQITGWRDPNADILASFGRWLGNSKHGQWLLILDNVDDAEVLVTLTEGTQGSGKRLFDYLPICDHGSMLITSRYVSEAEKIVHNGDIVLMGQPSLDHTVAILESKLGPDSDGLYQKLSSALDSLPLAISQAAAYIKERRPRASVESFLAAMERSSESRTSLLSREGRLPSRDWEASNSILLTWQISFEHLHATRQSAADLLSIMSFCDRQSIPEVLIGHGLCRDEACKQCSRHDFEENIAILRKFSLISTTTDPDSWEMHRLVQDATQMWLTDRNYLEVAQNRFLKLLHNAFPATIWSHPELYPICQALYPHVSITLSRIPTNNDALLDWSRTMLNAGWYLYGLYRMPEILSITSAAIDALRAPLGEDHQVVLSITDLLSLALVYSGRLEEAERMQKELVTVSTKASGPRNRDTLTYRRGLAEIYGFQNKLTDAENLHLEVLAATKEILGPHDADPVGSMYNLGIVYVKQKRWQDANNILVEALEASKISSGPDPYLTHSIARELAYVYAISDEGKLEEAEALMVEVLNRREESLGPDHPKTLVAKDELYAIYCKQRRFVEAIDLQANLVAQAKITLGPDHRETLRIMCNLSLSYWDAGRLDAAEELLASIVGQSVEVLGKEHADTQKRTEWLAKLRAGIAKSAAASTKSTSNGPGASSPTSHVDSTANVRSQHTEEQAVEEREAVDATQVKLVCRPKTQRWWQRIGRKSERSGQT